VVIPIKYDIVGSFREGLALARVEPGEDIPNYKYGYIDKEGKEVIPFKYDIAHDFSEGLVRVELWEDFHHGKTGFIDKEGKEVIPIKYDDVGFFSEGLARVKLNGKWGYIDKEGKVVIPIKYDMADDFSEGFAPVAFGELEENMLFHGKWGFVNKEGREVIPIKYDWAGSFSKGLAPVTFMGEEGYIDKEGTEYFVFVGNLKEVVTNIVEEWLQVQKRGESGDIYWTKPRLVKSLYAVREWEILNCSISENTASVTVRISSSTKKRFSNYKTLALYS